VDPSGNVPAVILMYLSVIGTAPDTPRDMMLLSESGYAFMQNPSLLTGICALADAVGVALPGVSSGGGRIIRELTENVDDAIDTVKSIKGTGKTTILGENMADRVIPFAEKTGSRTLPWGTTPEKWAKMTPKERWKLNDGTLRARINEGDSFRYIGKDINRPDSVRRQFNLTGSELLRLNERGVPYGVVSPEEVFNTIGRY